MTPRKFAILLGGLNVYLGLDPDGLNARALMKECAS